MLVWRHRMAGVLTGQSGQYARINRRVWPVRTYNSSVMANPTTTGKKRNRRRKRNSSAVPQATSQPAVSKGRDGILGQDSSGHTVYPLDIASPFKRLYAFGIDVLLLYCLIIFTKQIFGSSVWSPEAAPQDIAILLAYFIIPTGLFGRTTGKWVAGLRVVDTEGRVPGVAVAIPREMVGRWVSILAFTLGLAWIVFDKRRQGWHDKIAGTLVINTPNAGGPAFLRKMFKIEDTAKDGR